MIYLYPNKKKIGNHTKQQQKLIKFSEGSLLNMRVIHEFILDLWTSESILYELLPYFLAIIIIIREK